MARSLPVRPFASLLFGPDRDHERERRRRDRDHAERWPSGGGCGGGGRGVDSSPIGVARGAR